jgi:hypothetical protein
LNDLHDGKALADDRGPEIQELCDQLDVERGEAEGNAFGSPKNRNATLLQGALRGRDRTPIERLGRHELSIALDASRSDLAIFAWLDLDARRSSECSGGAGSFRSGGESGAEQWLQKRRGVADAHRGHGCRPLRLCG